MDNVDFLVVGQGLAGTLLSFNLIKSGKSVLVIDEDREMTSSKIAAGLYNPVTGRRMVKTWLADEIFPFLEKYYKEFEEFLEIQVLHPKPILRIFNSLAEQNYWYGQSADPSFKDYIRIVETEKLPEKSFHCPFGGFITLKSGYLNVEKLVNAFKTHLKKQEKLLLEKFDYDCLSIEGDRITYKGISTAKIIFCEGYNVRINPFFSYLGIDGTKGQIIDISIDNFIDKYIVNKGVFVLPLEGRQRVGSTYERNFIDELPSVEAEEEILGKLKLILKNPFNILTNKTAVRPTVIDRKPMLGIHPKFSNLFVFNGLGTKGVSLGPYFSNIMSDFLLYEKPLPPDVDIQRFAYLYH